LCEVSKCLNGAVYGNIKTTHKGQLCKLKLYRGYKNTYAKGVNMKKLTWDFAVNYLPQEQLIDLCLINNVDVEEVIEVYERRSFLDELDFELDLENSPD
jgi:hypothetical protein